MGDFVVLVNGLPGSGKTTLATRLARAMPATRISKDVIKEALADALPSLPSTALGRAASNAMWDLAADTPGPVVLDSWWFKPRDLRFVEDGLNKCGNPPAVEIWCAIAPGEALNRIRRRQRAAVHQDERHVAEFWPAWSVEAEPVGLAYGIVVGTDGPVDLAGLVERVRARQPGKPCLNQ
jgi:predicted kinase